MTRKEKPACDYATAAELAALTGFSTGHVYFLANASFIKIGYAKKPLERIKALQGACSERLELLATMPGSLPLEQHLHARFAALRVRGEWFHSAPELLRFIKAVATRQSPLLKPPARVRAERPHNCHSAAELAKKTGFSDRHYVRLAKRVDWAWQPGGPNTEWWFERAGFERWWNAGRSRAAERHPVVRPRTAARIDSPLRRRLLEMRARGC